MIARSITRTLTIVLVIFALIAVSAAGFYFGFTYVLSQNARFDQYDELYGDPEYIDANIDVHDPDTVEVVIPRAADTQEIAEILYENEVIDHVFLFTMLSRFNGFDGSYMAGTHFVTRTMSYDEIMYRLVQKPQAVRVTFPEGLTYGQIKQILKDNNVNFDEDILDRMVKNPQLFLDYDFIRRMEVREGRDWILQGYLFPDTYEFDLNTDEETIIRTFLNNTQRKLPSEYYERAEQLGMSMDEIITIASIVQMETHDNEEMRLVADVFHKRLDSDEFLLQASPTVNYLRLERGLDPVFWLSDYHIQRFSQSPYNTYVHSGLPPGPISSPGESAILATLYPQRSDYWYFSAGFDGSTMFATSLQGHENNIAEYDRQVEEAEQQDEEEEGDDA